MSESAPSAGRQGAPKVKTVMLQDLEVGTRLALRDGSTAEVTQNPRDGSWVFVRRLSPGGRAPEEELVFADDIVALAS